MTLGVIVWKLSAYFHNTAAVIKFPKNICRLKGYGVVAFSSYPWRYIKIVFIPEDFHKTWVYPLKNMGLPLKSMGLLLKNVGLLLKNMGLHMKNFTKIKDLPLKSTIVFFTLHPQEEILNFHNILPKNFIGRQTMGTDVKCNRPYCML